MTPDGSIARVDAAIAAVARGGSEIQVAEALVEHARVLSGSSHAEVVEISADSSHTVARAGGPTDLVLDADARRRIRTAAQSDDRALTLLSRGSDSAAVFVICGSPDHVVTLVIPGRLTASAEHLVGLLADIGGATIDRLHAERKLQGHSEQVRRLGAELLGLADAGVPGRDIDSPTGAELPPATDELTDREREILDIVTTGASNAQIAKQLTVSVETVKTHVKHILRKLNAANRSELIAMFGGGPDLRDSSPPPRRGPLPDRR